MNFQTDISKFIESANKNCIKIQRKDFKKDEIITTYIGKRNQICILISGTADLVRYDSNGNKSIVQRFSSNDIFGEFFYTVAINNELFVKARKNCEVLIFSYEIMKHKCIPNCKFHQELVKNVYELILNQFSILNNRIELLTQRTIKDKLLGYFSILSLENNNKTFALPISFTDLADYLSIDRSAMMRTIKSLQDEGLIKKNGNKITLMNR